MLSQEAKITYATDTAQEYSVTGKDLWPTKLHGYGLEPGDRESGPKFRLGHLVDFIFSAQGYVRRNQKALYWIESASQVFKVG